MGCQGGQISTPWDYIASTGAVTGGQQPFIAGTAGEDPDAFAADKSKLCSAFTPPHCHQRSVTRALPPLSRPTLTPSLALPNPPPVRKGSKRLSWLEVQLRLPSLCTPTSPTTSAASTITSVEVSRAAMLFALSDGVSKEATSTGRSPTRGTLTGVRRVISASSEEAVSVASRMESHSPQPTPSGPRSK